MVKGIFSEQLVLIAFYTDTDGPDQDLHLVTFCQGIVSQGLQDLLAIYHLLFLQHISAKNLRQFYVENNFSYSYMYMH